MTRREMRQLIMQKGWENEVTIPAADLLMLLDLANSYNFLRGQFEGMVKANPGQSGDGFNMDDWKRLVADYQEMAKLWKEKVLPIQDSMIPFDINNAVIGLGFAIGSIKPLLDMHPPVEWE